MTEAQTHREGLRNEPRIFLWILIAASAITRIILSSHELPNGLFDDAYVTLRYAENLMKGLGLVFNPGERAVQIGAVRHALCRPDRLPAGTGAQAGQSFARACARHRGIGAVGMGTC